MGVFRKVGGKIVDVRVDKWMSWGYLGETNQRFKHLLVGLVTPAKATHSETFEEAMQRLELTEADVESRKKEFVRLIGLFLAMAVLIIAYALFMAIKGSLATSLISFCLALYCLTQAFRFHFWLFQLRNRKLGCTFREWLNSEINRETGQDLTVKSSEAVVKPKPRKAKQ